MDQFGIKKALIKIADNEVVKMSSTDYKCHLFYKSTDNFGKPIIHEVIRNAGKNIKLHLTREEMIEKFGENKFYIYDK